MAPHPMEVLHMRKFASVSVALILAAGFITAAPASAAAISNGVACKKLNQSTTVGGRKYKCAKNPLSTSTKLTWLSNDCLVSANGYIKSRNSAAAISTQYAAQIPTIDLGIASETAKQTEIQAKLDETNLRLTTAKTKLAAATIEADKKVLTTAVSSWTSALRAYTSTLNATIAQLRKLQTARATAVNQPVQIAADIAGSKSTAQMICTKGL